jgi:hypothetical protein
VAGRDLNILGGLHVHVADAGGGIATGSQPEAIATPLPVGARVAQ